MLDSYSCNNTWDCDTSRGLYCANSSDSTTFMKCICQYNYFWNGTYCGNCFRCSQRCLIHNILDEIRININKNVNNLEDFR